MMGAAAPGHVLEGIGLSKSFPLGRGRSLDAVRDVSLRLPRGGVVALVGESGSGKSTVAKLLGGQLASSAGEVRLLGRKVDVKTRRAFRLYKRSVQVVLQDPFASLNPLHTVRYHLERAVTAHHPELERSEVQARAAELLTQVKLLPPDRYLAKFPDELSGGQRQRVAVARAVAATPQVLLADEPVSMLDVSVRLEVLGLLESLRRDTGVSILYITHDIASARYFADEIHVMYRGRVVESGTADEVTQRPAHPYTRLLIRSSPDPLSKRGTEEEEVSGSGAPPRSRATSLGCAFRHRCPEAVDRCRTEVPEPTLVTARHSASCWAAASGIGRLGRPVGDAYR